MRKGTNEQDKSKSEKLPMEHDLLIEDLELTEEKGMLCFERARPTVEFSVERAEEAGLARFLNERKWKPERVSAALYLQPTPSPHVRTGRPVACTNERITLRPPSLVYLLARPRFERPPFFPDLLERVAHSGRLLGDV
jgi:hypothetical protein